MFKSSGGCSDGNLTLWDVRKGTDEPLVVARHEGAILDVSDKSERVTQAYETIIAVNYINFDSHLFIILCN